MDGVHGHGRWSVLRAACLLLTNLSLPLSSTTSPAKNIVRSNNSPLKFPPTDHFAFLFDHVMTSSLILFTWELFPHFRRLRYYWFLNMAYRRRGIFWHFQDAPSASPDEKAAAPWPGHDTCISASYPPTCIQP